MMLGKYFHRWNGVLALVPSPPRIARCTDGVQRRYVSRPLRADLPYDLSEFTPEKIRNFCIIAHIDHGKTTLSDSLLSRTGTLSSEITSENYLYLDKLQVEKERGITVKAQTASMFYQSPTNESSHLTHLLNLIDTPGHVDFSYEVGRSMMACDGALLLVDATQGIQAQTQANLELALKFGLKIIPVITKIDRELADVEGVKDELELLDLVNIERKEILACSAKESVGITEILDAIVTRLPPPNGLRKSSTRLLLFDSWYTGSRITCMVCVKEGTLKKGDTLISFATKQKYTVSRIGVMYPEPVHTGVLMAGQVGFVDIGMTQRKDALIGDTLFNPTQVSMKDVQPFPGFRVPKPTVFASIYPTESLSAYELNAAVEKLCCNDSSVTVLPDSSDALGAGLRCGFLGALHMSIFGERLYQEFGASVIITPPSVVIQGIKADGTIVNISKASEFQDRPFFQEHREPMVKITVITPQKYLDGIVGLCEEYRGTVIEVKPCGTVQDRYYVHYRMPFIELITGFYSRLKQISSGFASMEYTEDGFEHSNLVKVDLVLNRKVVDCVSQIVHQSRATDVARTLVSRMKDALTRQLVEITIQATVRGKVVARESMKAYRKDVTAKCYGGDIRRQMKLLDAQKEGKKKMAKVFNLEVPKEVFSEILKM